MSKHCTHRFLTLAGLLLLSLPLHAASVTINNLDGPAEGFNDTTAATPVTGNAGTTLGEQRLNAFQAAANVFGAMLKSNVPISIDASLDPLPCTMSGAVLGAAGAQSVFGNFPNAYVPNTWYPVAVANSIALTDLCTSGACGGPADISATFNSDVDFNNNCLNMTDWYYGIGAAAPAGTVSFYETVLHEITHGIGLTTFVQLNPALMACAGGSNDGTACFDNTPCTGGGTCSAVTFGDELLNIPDITESFLEDHSTGMLWPAMTSTDRATSAVDTGDLHFTGANVRGACSRLETGTSASDGHVEMYAPSPFETGSSVAHFTDTMGPDELMEPFATTTFQSHMTRGLLKDIGWSDIVIAIRPAGDVNGGGEDIAVLIGDFASGVYAVYVMDGTAGTLIRKITLPSSSVPIDMEILDSFGGSAAKEVAVLQRNPANGNVDVSSYDASSGALVKTVPFAKAYMPFDLEIVTSYGGTAAQELAVLGRDFVADLLRVTMKDASSGALLNHVNFSKVFNAIDLEIVPNFADSAADELALLVRSCATDSVHVDVKDASSGLRHQKINFSKTFIPFDLEVMTNAGGITGTAADEVVVAGKRDSDKFVKIRVKDAQNAVQLAEVNFPAANDPIDLELATHFGGTSAQEMVLLARSRSLASIIIKTKDGIDGTNLSTTTLSVNRAPIDLGVSTDISGNGIDEMLVMTLRQKDNERRTLVVDTSTSVTKTSILIP